LLQDAVSVMLEPTVGVVLLALIVHTGAAGAADCQVTLTLAGEELPPALAATSETLRVAATADDVMHVEDVLVQLVHV
jgi:hypothetical protein